MSARERIRRILFGTAIAVGLLVVVMLLLNPKWPPVSF